ncbi:uncharacterized protein BDR25DRAFT_354030 [Lindgomyces ingoldianus]|uniref:Uncharacterized protein n=1 Tax=Lindgomyces ingoldianus TaxID=673940 RepID=A0ACB6QX85_9PLEO|nr:uncharacterized protein BDR25DRAFT_354030 [Lindgomyces ingoldianus]KAF2471495.1 hypothetical protein BDR25DRAFT_354030 [Lindgomyces ingoldianus]
MTQLAVPHSPNDVGWKTLSPALSGSRDRTDEEWLQLLDKSLAEPLQVVHATPATHANACKTHVYSLNHNHNQVYQLPIQLLGQTTTCLLYSAKTHTLLDELYTQSS